MMHYEPAENVIDLWPLCSDLALDTDVESAMMDKRSTSKNCS